MSLAGDALLDAGLLSTTSAATAATALAQGILGFVQKAGHICDVVDGLFVCFDVLRDWLGRVKLRGGGESFIICPGATS